MKWFLSITIAFLAVFTSGDVMAQGNHTPPCRARTLDLGAASCGSSFAGTHQKSAKPQSLQDDTTCQHLYNVSTLLEYHEHLWAAAYDTSKEFVERCPTSPYCSGAFGDMAGAVQNGGDGPPPGCYTDFRQWLISALPWNTHSVDYFCSDVQAMMGTYASTDTGFAAQNLATNEGMSILYWLIHNPACYSDNDYDLYVSGRGSQEETWFNTQDTSKVPLDTTIYTMQDLGLDSVLKYAALLGVSNNNTPGILSNASAYPNPTGKGTIISFSTNREAYVTLQIFNLLGVQVSSAPNFESVLEPGNHQVPISLAGLPSGTYYARIMTTYGEVQTVKIVKE